MTREELMHYHYALVQFSMDWCAPCKVQKVTNEKLCAEHSIQFFSLNCEMEDKFTRGLGIMSVPTTILYKGGEEVWRWRGTTDAGKILEFVK